MLGATQLGTKIIPLREVIDVAFAKADMVIYKGEGTDDGDDLDKQAQTCTIQGTVNVGSFPRYRQQGNDETVKFMDQYFCVRINEAKVFNDLNDGGDAIVWIDVQWAGVIKQTKQFKRPILNQTLYFKIPIPPAIKKNEALLEEFLQDELQTKSEFSVFGLG